MHGFLRSKNDIRKLIIVLFALMTAVAVSYSPRVYKYDSVTGLWKIANSDESEITVFPLSQNGLSNAPVSFQIEGTIVLQPTEALQKTAIDQFVTKAGQWYYYIEYLINIANNKGYFGVIAGQRYNIGTTTVWNDDEKIYVEFELAGGWLAVESQLNISDQQPTGNQNPGLFPYKMTHNPPTNSYRYSVPYSGIYEAGQKIYILFHLSVRKNGDSETAWAGGDPPSDMCVAISNTKALWYLRKPGVYATNAFQITVNASRQVAITFSNFDNLQPQGGIGLERIGVQYALASDFPDPSDWTNAYDLNNKSVILGSGSSSLNLYQLVNLQTQSSGIYTNVGTITFTLQNTKVYIESR